MSQLHRRGYKRRWHESWKYVLKQDVLRAYGGVCQKCGFSDARALQIDHINGGGKRERKRLNLFGLGFYRYLRKNNFPRGYQILCANCNWIKRSENKEYSLGRRKELEV